MNAFDLKGHGLQNLPLIDIDNGDRTANFSTGPQAFAVFAELDMARTLINQSVMHQFIAGCVDPVQHVGGFAGIHRPFTIRADRHPFWLNADINLCHYHVAFDIDHGDQGIVFIGDIQPFVVGV